MTQDSVIVLHKFPYKSGFIVDVFSKEHGKFPIILPSRKNKNNPIGNFQVLNLLQCQYSWKENANLQNLKSSQQQSIEQFALVDPSKMFIQFFFADFLKEILLPKVSSQRLFTFAEHIIELIHHSESKEIKDIPCYILFKTANILGINIICENNEYFDIMSGHSSLTPLLGETILKPIHITYLNNIEGMVFAQENQYLSDYKVRSQTFELLYRYFRIHINHFETLKSYSVLKQIML